MISTVATFLRTRLRAILIFVVLVGGIVLLVSYNRGVQAKTEAVLAGTSAAARDQTVLELAQRGRLVDVLTATQNPDDTDKESSENVRSLLIRKNAAESVNRLVAAGKLTPAQSFETLFGLCKDADLKATAETGLAALAGKSDANLKEITARMSNGDPDIRGAAVDVLAQAGGTKAAQAANGQLFVPAAADAAVSALQKIGEPSVPLILAHLNDPAKAKDIEFRQKMVGLLDQINSPASVSTLITLANTPAQPSVQRLAQVALADTVLKAYTNAQKDRDAVTTAQTAVGAAKTPAARTDAQKALADAQTARAKTDGSLPLFGPAEATLSALLQNTRADGESRAQAALALGSFPGSGAVPTLVTALGDFDARVRDAALAGVQAVGPPAVGPLSAALQNPATGASAAQALGGIGTPAAVAALGGVFTNAATPPAVREGAVIGLSRSGNPSVIPLLVRALGDPDGKIISAAQDGLITPALAKPAIPALVAALSQPSPVPFNASQTLGRMGFLTESDIVPALAEAASTGDASTQTWAAVTLGTLGSRKPLVLDTLHRLSQSADPHVQYAASQSLTALSGQAG